ncbi:MAG: response regulator [bacterium]
MAKKVLVVDDDPQNRRMLERLLLKLGHTPLACGSCQEALDAFYDNTNSDIDLVLSDIQLLKHGPDGNILHARIAEDLKRRQVEFVAMTGATPEDARTYFARHGVQVLEKPFGVECLEGILAELQKTR